MKVTNLWKSRQKPTVSFELFPPRSPKAAEKLEKTIDTLTALKPDFISVTFGAGGSTREGYGLGPDDINAVLDSYQALGVENVLVVRGDPPREQEDFTPHPQSFGHASDVIAFIRPRYSFCLGAAGYPEGHIDCESKDKDIEYLKLKVENGAEYIISNYFYDNKYFFDFAKRCRAIGIDVPIVPGVMPIYSLKMMKMLAEMCGATITDEVNQGIASLPEDDKEALINFGIEFATGKCRELLEAGVAGLHFYTMDLSKSTIGIVNRLRNDKLL
ncbi:MAG: methylenetetrahydrofolate reductase [Planctomycetota bacterium]|jgi:methylenetetrahydrofolate reductase (NADPH)